MKAPGANPQPVLTPRQGEVPPILGQRELEFSGVKAQLGESADGAGGSNPVKALIGETRELAPT